MAGNCPHCGLTNPPEAQRCDCGYDFAAGQVLGSYLTTKQVAEAAKKAGKVGKLTLFAAGLGLFQGLANIVFGALGGPPDFRPQGLSLAVGLMVLQGGAMIVFSVATYQGRPWAAYGLSAIAILFVAMSLGTEGTPGWIIPPLIYLGAAVALHRAVRPVPR
jgi:hypothetical protein